MSMIEKNNFFNTDLIDWIRTISWNIDVNDWKE
jgi:hypothetical protein